MNAVMMDSRSAALEPTPARQTRMAIPWPWVAGLSTAAAGALHLVASFDLRSGGNLVISAFLLTAFLQIGVALLFGGTYWRPVDTGAPGDRGPAPLWVLAAIVGTVALVGVYVVAHSTGLLAGLTPQNAPTAAGHIHSAVLPAPPVGSVPVGSPSTAPGNPPDPLGTLTLAVQLLSVAAFAALLPHSWRRRTVNALLALSALAWVLWLTGVLV